MPRTLSIAKYTLAFMVIAVGFAITFGTLMGGGSSRAYDSVKSINTDPRSILVQSILIETDAATAKPSALPMPGEQLSEAEFIDLLTEADRLRSVENTSIRTPAMLVQHAETGHITVRLGDRVFDAVISPRVIDTKRGAVLRVAIQLQRTDTDSSSTPRALTFETAYTAAPGGTVVLDLADIGLPASRAMLAIRTTLLDPTPTETN